ncbi:MAG: CehA/McbA family metallohydrolase [Planctomycetota bacterium]
MAATLSLVCPPSAAHQTPPNPPSSEVAKTQPALPGSAEFLRLAPQRLRGRCDDRQLELLDEILAHLQHANTIRWGHADSALPQRVAEYYRWRAEDTLLKFLADFSDAIRVDVRTIGDRDAAREALDLDQQHNSLLLHVKTGREGPVAFECQSWDLTKEETPDGLEVVIADEGETYALIQLTGAPRGETITRFPIRLKSDPEPRWWRAVSWKARPWGQLVVDIVDENGSPTHALLSLRSQRGGVLWPPAGALDFRPQLNDVVGPPIFEPGKGYTFYLPGRRRGHYWVVPPRVEMALPEGPWEITILRGPEHEAIRDRVDVAGNEWTRKRYQTRRWTNMSERGWWCGDDHVHARLLSGADAQRLLSYCEAVDLNLANILEMGDAMRTFYSQRGFGKDFRVNAGNRWLIPGQEDPRSALGHVIGMNLRSLVRDLDRYLLNDELAEEMHAQGGLYGHTHVGANACFAHRQMALFTPMDIVDFNSIMQADLGTELYYNFLNLGFKMTASAGSDTPYGGAIGNVRVYAYTGDHQQLDPDAWFDAVKRGRTFVSNGPMLDFRVEQAAPGELIELDSLQRLRVQAIAWGDRGSSAPKELRVVRLGEVAEVATSSDARRDRLQLDLELDSGNGCWIALHAVGHDGSQAHTTPVYVSVAGNRHWAVDKAPSLIKLQLSVLEEIEQALSESEALVAKGDNPVDFWNLTNARQAREVRARIEKARRHYLGLQKLLAQ